MSRLPQVLRAASGLATLLGTAMLIAMAAASEPPAPALSVRHVLTYSAYQRGPLHRPEGVSFDPIRKEIYVTEPSDHEVVVLNPKAMPLFRFQHQVKGPYGDFVPGEPLDVLAGDQGVLYITDRSSDRIDVVDFRGRSLRSIDVTALLGTGRAASPGRMVRDAAGNLYVTEGTTSQVLVISREGKLVRKLSTGQPARQGAAMLVDVAVDAGGNVYALDSQREPSLQILDLQGKLLTAFGEHSDKPEGLHFPAAAEVDGEGRLWVVDSFAHEVKGFSETGELLTVFGGMGMEDGRFYFPADVACGADNMLYVVERGGDRLQAFHVEKATPARPPGAP